MVTNIFTSKADTLKFLQEKTTKSKIEQSFDFTTEEWKKDNLNNIRKRLTGWQLESFNESYEYKINILVSFNDY